MSKVFVFDVETTGINVLKDDPIQIGYMVFQNRKKIVEEEIFLKTKFLPPKITEITKITQEMLDEKGISHHQAAEKWKNALWDHDPDIVVGHNVIAFDMMLMNNWLLRTLANEGFKLPPMNCIYDTMMASRKILKLKKWLSLQNLAEKLNIEVDPSRFHNALYDIEITAKCYFALNPEELPSAPSEQGSLFDM